MTERILIAKDRRLILGGSRPLLMGIVNATPDSFFDRGRYFDREDPSVAVEQAMRLLEEGADIIDVGGETAQPSSPIVPPEQEIKRVVPVIERLAQETDAVISVDTYKVEVARAALEAGASIINDTSGLADPQLADVAREHRAGLVLMHIPCHPKERITPGYPDPIGAVSSFLQEKIDEVVQRGVDPQSLIIDPGVGFGKTPSENLDLIAGLDALKLGPALLFACSRRTFLGDFLGGQPPEERLEATAAVNAVACWRGADILRVHDVGFFRRFTTVLGLVLERGR